MQLKKKTLDDSNSLNNREGGGLVKSLVIITQSFPIRWHVLFLICFLWLSEVDTRLCTFVLLFTLSFSLSLPLALFLRTSFSPSLSRFLFFSWEYSHQTIMDDELRSNFQHVYMYIKIYFFFYFFKNASLYHAHLLAPFSDTFSFSLYSSTSNILTIYFTEASTRLEISTRPASRVQERNREIDKSEIMIKHEIQSEISLFFR